MRPLLMPEKFVKKLTKSGLPDIIGARAWEREVLPP